jgi:hypothetical protein
MVEYDDSDDSTGGELHYCSTCCHFMQTVPVRLFSSGRALSPKQIEAAAESAKLERERRDVEAQRLRDPSYKFNYPPITVPWCKLYTPTKEQLAPYEADLLKGVHPNNLVDRAKQDKFEILVYPATGRVEAVYALCERRNKDYHCEGHKRTEA